MVEVVCQDHSHPGSGGRLALVREEAADWRSQVASFVFDIPLVPELVPEEVAHVRVRLLAPVRKQLSCALRRDHGTLRACQRRLHSHTWLINPL